MALRNTATRYGSLAKTLHWLVFFMLTTLLIVGYYMPDLEKPLKFTVYNIHKLTGITLLGIMLFRLYWTLSNTKLGYPSNLSQCQIRAARSIHFLLYALVIAMPISGWVMSTASGYSPNLFGISLRFPFLSESKAIASFFKDAHFYLAWSILVAVSAHILAALKHHFINKDDILTRMLPFTKR
jgi:cytochrome b561